MKPGVYQIQNDNLSVVYKGFVFKYTGNVREKIWCEGVQPTRGKAERQAKALMKML